MEREGWGRGMLTINITTRGAETGRQAGDPPAKCRCEQMTPSKLAANPRNFYYFDSKHAHKSQHTGWKTTGYFGKWGYLFNSVRQFLFVLRKTF